MGGAQCGRENCRGDRRRDARAPNWHFERTRLTRLATINPHNPSLQFVYQRVGPARMEEIWVPITPKWLVTVPRPVDQSVPADGKPPPPAHWVDE
ncbi:MAG: hypothetical protein LBG65_03720 [Puniceicoccales bacterium]|nr:hypothetical protein [Puniceicoccales bacterium]